jgi:hypothetical protein
LNQEVAQAFFAQVKKQAVGLMSDEHFTVDGTLIEAWASHKSFQRKDKVDGGPDSGRNFHGEERRNDTHASKTGGGGNDHTRGRDGGTRRRAVDGGGSDQENQRRITLGQTKPTTRATSWTR